MDRATGSIERVIQKIKCRMPREMVITRRRKRHSVRQLACLALALLLECRLVGFAPIDIDVDRTERTDRRQPRSRATAGAASTHTNAGAATSARTPTIARGAR